MTIRNSVSLAASLMKSPISVESLHCIPPFSSSPSFSFFFETIPSVFPPPCTIIDEDGEEEEGEGAKEDWKDMRGSDVGNEALMSREIWERGWDGWRRKIVGG